MEALSGTQNEGTIQWIKDFKTPLIVSIGLAAISLAVIFGVLPHCGLTMKTAHLSQAIIGAATLIISVPLLAYLTREAYCRRHAYGYLLKQKLGIDVEKLPVEKPKGPRLYPISKTLGKNSEIVKWVINVGYQVRLNPMNTVYDISLYEKEGKIWRESTATIPRPLYKDELAEIKEMITDTDEKFKLYRPS